MHALQRFALRGLTGLAVLSSLATPALAQQETPKPPFDVNGIPHGGLWVPWVVAFVFIIGCAAVAFRNPRRSHLD